jgi:phage terminase large subunit-like protein
LPTHSTKHAGPPGSVREIRQRLADRPTYERIGPNSEPQAKFLGTSADIALYGGGSGGGKTFSMLLEPLRHLSVPGFGAVFFRRTRPELTQEKGAWDGSQQLYYGIGGLPNFSDLKWYFRSGATIKFAAVDSEKEVKLRWGSAQIALLLIDQVETFSERMFWGLISRNRSVCGVKPYCRMGCNPDPDSWLAEFIAWWLDDDGYAIPERSGVVRYFTRWGEQIYWADTREELQERFGRPGGRPVPIKSFTFIPAKLSDNVDLERINPEYRATLEQLPIDERLRLLGDSDKGGNWKIKIGSSMFPPGAWRLVDGYAPAGTVYVRYWDTAATAYGDASESKRGAATAGVLIGLDHEGPIVLDVAEAWLQDAQRDEFIRNTTELDRTQYGHVVTWFEQEPGGSGKTDAAANLRLLEGFEAYAERATGDKVIRARPWASAVQAGRVRVLKREWTKGFIDQHSAFPLSKRKDKVDAASGAYAKIAEMTPTEGTGIVPHTRRNPADRLPAGTF